MGAADNDDVHAKKFRKELNSGLAALVVLGVLGRAGGEMYGYQIAKDLPALGGDEPPFKEGALYPVLRQLHGAGLLTSRVEVSISGPPRRYYAITDEGRSTLAAWRGIWGATRDFIDAAIAGDKSHD